MIVQTAQRWIVLAAFAASFSIGAAAGSRWTDNRMSKDIARMSAGHQATLRRYETDYAESLRRLNDAIIKREQIAAEEMAKRDAEIDRLAALAAAIPPVVRVRVPASCPSAVPSGADGVSGSAASAGSAGSILPDGVGEDSRELDIRPVTALMERADRLRADLMATIQSCTRNQ